MNPTLKTYQLVWTGRDRDGNPTYDYDCTWSDGSASREFTLPWDRMGDAVELPSRSEKVAPVTLDQATDDFCKKIASPYEQQAAHQRKADIAFVLMLFATMPVLGALVMTWPI